MTPGGIAGHVDLLSRDLVEGWLHVPGDHLGAVVEVLHGAQLLGACRADRPRADLAAAGFGACGFSFLVPLEYDVAEPGTLRLRLAGTPLFLLPDAATRISRGGG
ncbi:MAG: hypothetical protein NT133_25725 [Alphaproteobacteria bacterium]|nr:hypothetical protein [Alphaproteobacteria bacterium]